MCEWMWPVIHVRQMLQSTCLSQQVHKQEQRHPLHSLLLLADVGLHDFCRWQLAGARPVLCQPLLQYQNTCCK
jgi:hypothetical protein